MNIICIRVSLFDLDAIEIVDYSYLTLKPYSRYSLVRIFLIVSFKNFKLWDLFLIFSHGIGDKRANVNTWEIRKGGINLDGTFSNWKLIIFFLLKTFFAPRDCSKIVVAVCNINITAFYLMLRYIYQNIIFFNFCPSVCLSCLSAPAR